MDTIEFINILYPEVYDTANKLFTFEMKVHQSIDDTYGKNTVESIIHINEFNKEIENVRQKKLKNTKMNRLAQKYNKYYDEYSLVTYNLKNKIGIKETLTIMESLEKYFKSRVNLS